MKLPTFLFLLNFSMFNDVFDFLLPIIIHFDEPNILNYSTSNHTKKKFKKQKNQFDLYKMDMVLDSSYQHKHINYNTIC